MPLLLTFNITNKEFNTNQLAFTCPNPAMETLA